jgi:V8-like Glu-specific endopeptidase
LRINSSGYPGGKPYGTQWWNSNNILAVTARCVYYRIDTYFGQSGSPNWRYKNGKRHIVCRAQHRRFRHERWCAPGETGVR